MHEIILGAILSEKVVTIKELSKETGFSKEEILLSLDYLTKKGLLNLNYSGEIKNRCKYCILLRFCHQKNLKGGIKFEYTN